MKPDERLVGVSTSGKCVCGNEPTCVGSYGGDAPTLGCNGCCGHGDENGWCVDVVKERHARELVVAEARGFERAREHAATIASNMAHNCGVAAAGMGLEANRRAWLKAQEMSADVEQSIRAMEDERGEGEG